MVVFIIGGARSGKSSLAEKIAAGQENKYGRQIIYLATAKAKDKEMGNRIEKHQKQRPDNWWTIEAELYPYQAIKSAEIPDKSVVILDCLTLLLTNHMINEEEFKLQKIKEELKDFIKALNEKNCLIIFVANETGLGIVPASKLGRQFRDEAGRLNQWVAAQSDKTFFTVAGIPMELDKKKLTEDILNPESFYSGGKSR
ncbi:MAG: bifunctional adenosylcobinamide kinase/adenosylcobinamide-phosphate guanylyltransferase [Bacillota bacterium]